MVPAQITANWHAGKEGPLHVEMTTARLQFRSIQEEDVEHCIKLFGDSQVMLTYCEGVARSAEKVKAYVKVRSQRWQNNNPLSSFVVFLKETQEFVGHTDFDETDQDSAVELGYILLKEHQGKGYGPEIAEAMMKGYLPAVIANKYQVKNKPITQAIAVVLESNVKSIHILEKLGMKYVKDIKKYSDANRQLYSLALPQNITPLTEANTQ
jgi:[ribosomal protein S5]-alanine N-acetyltransferase